MTVTLEQQIHNLETKLKIADQSMNERENLIKKMTGEINNLTDRLHKALADLAAANEFIDDPVITLNGRRFIPEQGKSDG